MVSRLRRVESGMLDNGSSLRGVEEVKVNGRWGR